MFLREVLAAIDKDEMVEAVNEAVDRLTRDPAEAAAMHGVLEGQYEALAHAGSAAVERAKSSGADDYTAEIIGVGVALSCLALKEIAEKQLFEGFEPLSL